MSIHDIAIDSDGRPLPYTPEKVRQMMTRIIDEGEIVAVIVRVKDDIAAEVFGPPSAELLDVLETLTRAIRTALRGH